MISGIVYVIQHRESGLRYVGATTKRLMERWSDHKSEAKTRGRRRLYQAIRESGPDAFDVFTVAVADSRIELTRLEMAWTVGLGTNDPAKGYNDSIGYKRSAQALQKHAASHRGKPLSAAHRAAVSRGNKGKPKSPAHCAALKAARLRYLAASRALNSLNF